MEERNLSNNQSTNTPAGNHNSNNNNIDDNTSDDEAAWQDNEPTVTWPASLACLAGNMQSGNPVMVLPMA